MQDNTEDAMGSLPAVMIAAEGHVWIAATRVYPLRLVFCQSDNMSCDAKQCQFKILELNILVNTVDGILMIPKLLQKSVSM